MALFMAKDPNGGELWYRAKSARQGLLEAAGKKSARKIYRDRVDGTARHIGWIVGGVWYTVWEMRPLEE